MGAGIAVDLMAMLKLGTECSTPGGMGAGIAPVLDVAAGAAGGAVLNARRHGSGDRPRLRCGGAQAARGQRPEAWERGSPHLIAGLDEVAPNAANARRHGSGDRPPASAALIPSGVFACQRPEAWERGSLHPSMTITRGGSGVLNARRHGSGDRPTRQPRLVNVGLVLNARRHGSGDRSRSSRSRGSSGTCAQRPEAWERRGSPARLDLAASLSSRCSTPGGMGAAIARIRRGEPRRAPAVLNARRHGSGDHPGQHPCPTTEPFFVLNARRHGSGDRPAGDSARRPLPSSAQRPEAWERGSLAATSPTATPSPSAQRPEAWERGSHTPIATTYAPSHLCSTPGGMGAGIASLV